MSIKLYSALCWELRIDRTPNPFALLHVPMSVLPCRHRAVLIKMADAAEEDSGKCWMSAGTLARWTGQAVSTVEIELEELEIAGWIAGERRFVGKRRLSTKWTINITGGRVHERGSSSRSQSKTIPRGPGYPGVEGAQYPGVEGIDTPGPGDESPISSHPDGISQEGASRHSVPEPESGERESNPYVDENGRTPNAAKYHRRQLEIAAKDRRDERRRKP